jgi:hypothetical protein
MEHVVDQPELLIQEQHFGKHVVFTVPIGRSATSCASNRPDTSARQPRQLAGARRADPAVLKEKASDAVARGRDGGSASVTPWSAGRESSVRNAAEGSQ